MKCAFQEVSRGPRGSCKGDSGGPLLSYQTNGGFYVQTGVVQGSDGCGDANFPTIFGRIQDPEIFSFIKKVGTVMLAQDMHLHKKPFADPFHTHNNNTRYVGPNYKLYFGYNQKVIHTTHLQ